MDAVPNDKGTKLHKNLDRTGKPFQKDCNYFDRKLYMPNLKKK